MKIGNLVLNNYHDLLRFGKITSKRIDKEDGWAYFKVKWYFDEKYEEMMEDRKQLSHKDYKLEEYRKDQIKHVSLEFLQKVLEEHINEF
jgi:hypothetical protein